MAIRKLATTPAFNAADYEARYQAGYGHAHPESHIIRVHRHILEWELQLQSGRVFDFGCGSGANLRYFLEQGFIPYGCDSSRTAIERCQHVMPAYASHFRVSEITPNLSALFPEVQLDVFVSNQVLYFLTNDGIRSVVAQAYSMLRKGGVFVATMMAPTCWYMQHAAGNEGEFRRIVMHTPRENVTTLINFKERDELVGLFSPFRKLHIGSYGSWIREDEGSTDHWIYVGIRN